MAKRGTSQSQELHIRATPTDASDREHLISVIQNGTGSTKIAAKETLDALLETVAVSLQRNKRVQLTGFGAFSISRRRARNGVNPQTGDPIRIQASNTVRFKPGADLKDLI